MLRLLVAQAYLMLCRFVTIYIVRWNRRLAPSHESEQRGLRMFLFVQFLRALYKRQTFPCVRHGQVFTLALFNTTDRVHSVINEPFDVVLFVAHDSFSPVHSC